jgi:hypothetical protein
VRVVCFFDVYVAELLIHVGRAYMDLQNVRLVRFFDV